MHDIGFESSLSLSERGNTIMSVRFDVLKSIMLQGRHAFQISTVCSEGDMYMTAISVRFNAGKYNI